MAGAFKKGDKVVIIGYDPEFKERYEEEYPIESAEELIGVKATVVYKDKYSGYELRTDDDRFNTYDTCMNYYWKEKYLRRAKPKIEKGWVI